MRLCLLDDTLDFPEVSTALTEPNGLLAVGGDLSPTRLLAAYRRGIFPWFSEGDPILWWSPNPRCVIYPMHYRPSRSSRKFFRQSQWSYSINQDFAAVIQACASNRAEGTWISPAMMAAYEALHELGFAHSIEIWQQDELIGGLYGLKIGQMFFGESMFSKRSNGSKAALYQLCQECLASGVELIDCQVENPHLLSLGAELLPRQQFTQQLQRLVDAATTPAWYASRRPLLAQ